MGKRKKKHGLDALRYDCKENDNRIYVDLDENELLIGDELESAWLVIGIEDMKNCLRLAGYVYRRA